jgi:hypothetical protein
VGNAVAGPYIIRAVTVDELFDAWERAGSGRDPAAFVPLCAPAFLCNGSKA